MGDGRLQSLLDAAEKFAGTDDSLALFLAAAIRSTDPDDLARQEQARLLEVLAQSHARLAEGEIGATRIHITPPARAGDPMLVDVISPDMPFIVDSVLGALRAMGGA